MAKPKLPKLKVWVRAGDGDDYHGYLTLQLVARYLYGKGVQDELKWCNEYGVTATGFKYQNYISLFWGHRKDDPTRALTDAELAEINSKIIGKTNHGK